MIEEIKKLEADKAKNLLTDFMEIYLSHGFGTMNKTDMETLMYHVLKEHKVLSGKCFEDSLELKIPEAKARKLIYESQVKYAGFDENKFRKSLGDILTRAFLSKNGKEIRFAIEDKYMQVVLNAKLRGNNRFADTSFNRDIVSMDGETFAEMIDWLVPNIQPNEVLEKLTAIDIKESVKNGDGKDWLKSVVGKIIETASVQGLAQLISVLTSFMQS